jgi:hypothetical protein
MNTSGKTAGKTISASETHTLLTTLAEPFLTGLRLPDSDKVVSVIQLDPTATHDRRLYQRLYNEPDKFEVLHETEHGGRYSAILVIRYVRKTSEDVGRSSAEIRMDEIKKDAKQKARKTASGKKAGNKPIKRRTTKKTKKTKAIGFVK